MTKRTRRNHSGSFKVKVALAALRGDKTLTGIAQHYEVHANQVSEWKRQLEERAGDVFDGGVSNVRTDNEPDIKTLDAKIGPWRRRRASSHASKGARQYRLTSRSESSRAGEGGGVARSAFPRAFCLRR